MVAAARVVSSDKDCCSGKELAAINLVEVERELASIRVVARREFIKMWKGVGSNNGGCNEQKFLQLQRWFQWKRCLPQQWWLQQK